MRCDVVTNDRKHHEQRSNRFRPYNVKLVDNSRTPVAAIVQELGKEVHEAQERESGIVRGVEARSCGTSWEWAYLSAKNESSPELHRTGEPGVETEGCLLLKIGRCWER